MPEPDPNAAPPADETDPNHIKNLRKRAERTDAAENKATTLEREMAFIKAGFDTDHPLVARLMASYDGELNKDAIVKEMTDLKVTPLFATQPPAGDGQQPPGQEGTGAPPPGTPPGDAGQQQPPAGTQSQDRQGTIDGGQPPSTVPPEDPRFVGLTKAFDAMEKGATREDAASLFFQEVLSAAVAGDQRVLTVNNREGAPEPQPGSVQVLRR